jgi:hypothetical protein
VDDLCVTLLVVVVEDSVERRSSFLLFTASTTSYATTTAEPVTVPSRRSTVAGMCMFVCACVCVCVCVCVCACVCVCDGACLLCRVVSSNLDDWRAAWHRIKSTYDDVKRSRLCIIRSVRRPSVSGCDRTERKRC